MLRIVAAMTQNLAPCSPSTEAPDCGTPVIEWVDAAALEGVKRVAVPSFTVNRSCAFRTRSGYTSSTTGGRRTDAMQTAGQGGDFNITPAEDAGLDRQAP